MDSERRSRRAGTLLRCLVALLLAIHGVARLRLGIVDDFGVFLTTQHIPFGPAVAWTLTVVEIAGGAALALGIAVRPLCAWFAVQLLAGIALVHGPEGWFVVGAGRNGVEYSVLLLGCLAVVALLHPRTSRGQDRQPLPDV